MNVNTAATARKKKIEKYFHKTPNPSENTIALALLSAGGGLGFIGVLLLAGGSGFFGVVLLAGVDTWDTRASSASRRTTAPTRPRRPSRRRGRWTACCSKTSSRSSGRR